jgi:hypothetical protein
MEMGFIGDGISLTRKRGFHARPMSIIVQGLRGKTIMKV